METLDLKPRVAYLRHRVLEEGNPHLAGYYFTDLGRVHFRLDTGWNIDGVPCNAIEWYLMPYSCIVILKTYLDNAETDYIAVRTKHLSDDTISR